MASRLQLHDLLQSIAGKNKVYYQPPSNHIMQYPCIRYTRIGIPHKNADNVIYGIKHRYQIIVIDQNPDSPMVDKIAQIPRVSHVNHYVADGLNHDTFEIIY